MTVTAYIALGSNLGDRAASLNKDLALLAHPGYKFLDSFDTPDDQTFVARWK